MLLLTKKAWGRLGPRPRLWHLAVPRSPASRCYATQLDLPALDRKWRAFWQDKEKEAREQAETIASQESRNDAADGEAASSEDASSQKNHEKQDKKLSRRGGDKTSRKHMYILSMFPYPSGNLHLGHLRVYTIADVVARYRRLCGKDVLLPMGWDAFGLPAENAAIERGIDPAVWTRENIDRMREQLELMNGSFNWSREFATCDPDYYKHTQKIFLYLYRLGLVSQQLAQVNWDPVDQTVLANEQVDAEGRSWRSGAPIEIRSLKQWFFHITKFQEALHRDLKTLGLNDAWPERVLAMQKNWLGREQCAYYGYQICSPDGRVETPVKIFTTRPETVFAARYIAISSNHPIVKYLARYDENLRKFLQWNSLPLSQETTNGYLLPNLTAVFDLPTPVEGLSQRLPVYVAPYVRGDYETGAVMGVPAHDSKDYAFWQRNKPVNTERNAVTPMKYAVTSAQDGSTTVLNGKPFLDSGFMSNETGEFSGLPSKEAAEKLVALLQKKTFGIGNPVVNKVNWRLRDWLISRQRYWGTPIPIIHCPTCGPQAVPDEDLPVKLPKVDHHWADGKAGNPLESATEWINTTCPKCYEPAKRDTDTMDTFVDSSWYYLRFADPGNETRPIDLDVLKKRLPVDLYIGGVEHAILHLLYARFIYKAVTGILHSKDESGKQRIKYKSDAEPFKKLITQGMVHGKTYSDPDTGRFLKLEEVDLSNPSNPRVIATGQSAKVSFEKMSKSKYNGVDPTSFISKYGADATRAHMLFQAPVSEVVNWDETKISGITRWLKRLYDWVQTLPSAPEGSQWDLDWRGHAHFDQPPSTEDPAKATQWEQDVAVWRALRPTILSVNNSYKNVYSLNTVVSDLMSLTNKLQDNPLASVPVKVHAASALLRMLAPITPAFAEECWSHLWPSSQSIFDLNGLRRAWPAPVGSLDHLPQPKIMCAVQVNGKLRCVVEVPPKPDDLGDNPKKLNEWITNQILLSEASTKLTKDGHDIRNAKKVIAVRGGKTVNYVL